MIKLSALHLLKKVSTKQTKRGETHDERASRRERLGRGDLVSASPAREPLVYGAS